MKKGEVNNILALYCHNVDFGFIPHDYPKYHGPADRIYRAIEKHYPCDDWGKISDNDEVVEEVAQTATALDQVLHGINSKQPANNCQAV